VASELVAVAALWGFGAAALATVIRTFFAGHAIVQRKPLSCDLCMAFWCVTVHAIVLGYDVSPVVLSPAVGLAWLVLTLGRHGEPPGSILDD
jgi:hypothetical protein